MSCQTLSLGQDRWSRKIKLICSDCRTTNLSNLLLIVINCSGVCLLLFAAPLWGREALADVQGRQLQEGPEEVRPPHRRPQEAAGESLRRRGEGTTAVLSFPAGFRGKPERFGTAAPVFVYSDYIRKSLGDSYTAAAYCAADRLPPSEPVHEWILFPWAL